MQDSGSQGLELKTFDLDNLQKAQNVMFCLDVLKQMRGRSCYQEHEFTQQNIASSK